MSNNNEKALAGSSPRVWGELPCVTHRGRKSRVIPTGVGRAREIPIFNISIPGHPHGCGESLPAVASATAKFGSSPRVWGELSVVLCAYARGRVIPTGVGRAPKRSVSASIFSGHPHGCGESYEADPVAAVVVGSSPRVWGELYQMNDLHR